MFPAACARSQPTTAPASWPAAVSRSISSACPVAKLTPPRKTSARSSALYGDGRLEVLDPDEVLALARSDDDEVGRRIQPALGEMARQGVAIGREERTVGEDPPAPAIGPEERGKQQVDVDGQAVEQRDLDRTGADDAGHRLAQGRVQGEPRTRGVEPGVDCRGAPRRPAPSRSRRPRSAAAARATGPRGRSRACRRARSGCGTGRASSASALRPRRVPARPPRSWAGLRCRANCERRVAFGDA